MLMEDDILQSSMPSSAALMMSPVQARFCAIRRTISILVRTWTGVNE